MADAKTVAMTRDPALYPEPHTADVHPDEVEVFKAGGWEVVKAKAKPAKDDE